MHLTQLGKMHSALTQAVEKYTNLINFVSIWNHIEDMVELQGELQGRIGKINSELSQIEKQVKGLEGEVTRLSSLTDELRSLVSYYSNVDEIQSYLKENDEESQRLKEKLSSYKFCPLCERPF
jgi:predicted  nucleic acid-binding Zn-ribbon protein